jgi:hypothetical protein
MAEVADIWRVRLYTMTAQSTGTLMVTYIGWVALLSCTLMVARCGTDMASTIGMTVLPRSGMTVVVSGGLMASFID